MSRVNSVVIVPRLVTVHQSDAGAISVSGNRFITSSKRLGFTNLLFSGNQGLFFFFLGIKSVGECS
jgi:hypothetical protein